MGTTMVMGGSTRMVEDDDDEEKEEQWVNNVGEHAVENSVRVEK